MAFDESKKKNTNNVPDGHCDGGLFVENVLVMAVTWGSRPF